MILFNKDLAGIPGQLVSWEPSSRAEVLAGPAARLLLSEEGDLALSSLPAELVQLAKPE